MTAPHGLSGPGTGGEIRFSRYMFGGDDRGLPLTIKNVYSGGKSPDLRLNMPGNLTIAEVKQAIEHFSDEKPAPARQKLIYRGKICEDSQLLQQVIQTVEGGPPQVLHLVLSRPPADQERWRTTGQSAAAPPPQTAVQQPHGHGITQGASAHSTFDATQPPLGRIPSASGSSGPSIAPTPVHNSYWPIQSHIGWYYQQQLAQYQQQLAQHRQQVDQQLAPRNQQWEQQLQQQIAQLSQLGASFPMPLSPDTQTPLFAPGNVPTSPFDVAAPPYGVPTTQGMAGVGGGVQAAEGMAVQPVALVPAVAPPVGDDVGPVELGGGQRDILAMVDFKLALKFIFMMYLMGQDGDPLRLLLLFASFLAVFLFKTGIAAAVWASATSREGGSAVTRLLSVGTGAITEGGGLLSDMHYLASSFVLSLIPSWHPMRAEDAGQAPALAGLGAAQNLLAAAN